MHALMPPSHGCEPCRTRKYIQPLFSRACAPARARPPAAPAAAAGLRVLCMRACSWRGTSASVALLGGRQADSKQRRLILHVRSTLSPILYIRRATWPRQHCYIFYYAGRPGQGNIAIYSIIVHIQAPLLTVRTFLAHRR